MNRPKRVLSGEASTGHAFRDTAITVIACRQGNPDATVESAAASAARGFLGGKRGWQEGHAWLPRRFWARSQQC